MSLQASRKHSMLSIHYVFLLTRCSRTNYPEYYQSAGDVFDTRATGMVSEHTEKAWADSVVCVLSLYSVWDASLNARRRVPTRPSRATTSDGCA